MNNRDARKITEKANKKVEKEIRKEVKSLIRTLKADVKKTAKRGISDFRVKIRNAEIYKRAMQYFKDKGFRCWEHASEGCKYLVIEW